MCRDKKCENDHSIILGREYHLMKLILYCCWKHLLLYLHPSPVMDSFRGTDNVVLHKSIPPWLYSTQKIILIKIYFRNFVEWIKIWPDTYGYLVAESWKSVVICIKYYDRLYFFAKFHVVMCHTRILIRYSRCLKYARVRVYPPEYKDIVPENHDFPLGALIWKASTTQNFTKKQKRS